MLPEIPGGWKAAKPAGRSRCASPDRRRASSFICPDRGLLTRLMEAGRPGLACHPMIERRIDARKRPATGISLCIPVPWPWRRQHWLRRVVRDYRGPSLCCSRLGRRWDLVYCIHHSILWLQCNCPEGRNYFL
jgi:hypothetical protein